MKLSDEKIAKDLLFNFIDVYLADKKQPDGDFRIEEEIEVDYGNIDAATFRDLDSFMHCCSKCHCHPQNNMVNPNNNGKTSNCSGTSASSPSVSISPGHKKLQASALNYIHCHGHGNCFSHKHPNHRANHHQVKMRLKEKSKKKLEEKAAAVSGCAQGQGSFIHESINPNSAAFSKFDQMAAACGIQDPSLAMGLLSAAASLNMDPNNIIDYHDHHHHSHHPNTTVINANSNNQNTMTTTNNNNHSTATASQPTSVALSSTNNTVTTTSTISSKSSTASPSQTSAAIQTSVNTNGKKQLQSTAQQHQQQQQQQQQQRKTSKSSNHQEDVCTKKDDCNCMECIKRQRIVEELIAEEESSKKKKQKKKKNKNKQNKQSSLASNNIDDGDGQSEDVKLIKTDNENFDETIEEEHQEGIKSKSTDNQSSGETTKPQQKTENFSKATSIKKNKKNKQSSAIAFSIEPEIVATSSSVTTMTGKNTNSENTSKKKSNKDATQVGNNSENGETVEIQQWIKVKNKSKQNSTSNNQPQNLNNNQNSNSNYPDAWYSSGVDDMDPSGHNNNEDVEGNAEGEDNNDNSGGFKVIHSDRRRMSSNNNNNNNNNSNDDNNSGSNNDGSGCLSSRINSLNSVGMMAKAKLMAIEAQIAFNNNELKGAVQYISDAIELDGRNPVYFLNRAFFHERLNEFEHALKDTESALRFDESKEYLDHALYLKAKALIGLEQHEKGEQILLKIRSLSCKPKTMPFLEKDLLLLRMRKLVHCNYTIPLARLYAFKYQTIMDAHQALEQNCNLLIEKKLNESDPKYHLMLIRQQQQQRSSFCWPDDSEILMASSSQLKILEEETKSYITLNNVDYDDDELYFSDDDERQIWYSHPDHWHQPKDILKKDPVQFEDTKEPPNSKGQKALWIGNVSPSCSLTFVTNLFMKFGNVTFCKIFPNEQRTSGDVAYLLLHYDNDISPRLVMSYFKDKVVPGISKDDSCPLLIRFRNKNDKPDETNGDTCGNSTNISTNLQNFSGPSTGNSNVASLTNSPTTKTVSECYYWRTTGCDRQHCTFRHVIGNKGIDKQAWMRKKN